MNMTTYNQRITIFIDILGFRNIVAKTANDASYTQKIFDVLNSMKSEIINTELFGEVNEQAMDDTELKQVKEMQSMVSKALKAESSIRVTHFSDSIVMSIGLENDMYAMSLIEYVGRLIYRLWKDFGILIRGGIAVDKLIHNEDGALFGPAMVKAYDFETNLAVYPRIVLDEYCGNIVRNSPSYKPMQNMFKPFEGERKVKDKVFSIKNGLEINLATSINHLLNSLFGVHAAKRNEILTIKNTCVADLTARMNEIECKEVKEKYQYLIHEINSTNFPEA